MTKTKADARERRFVVVGCGSIGKRHIANLQKSGVRRITAFDVSEQRRNDVAQRFSIPAADSLDSAAESGADAALICSPTALHLEHAMYFAERGCDLFIEKPVAHGVSGVESLQKLIEKRQLATLVGCNFRFHPGLRRVKQLLEAGVAGRVVSARAQFGQYLPDWHPWEDYRRGYSAQQRLGGGVVLDRIHEIDYLRWLLGGVAEVCAMTGRLSHLQIDTEDTAELMLRFQSGAIGSIHVDYVRRAYDCSLEITGDEGSIAWSFSEHTVRCYRAADRSWQQTTWPHYDANDMYLQQTEHFLRVLDGLEPPEQDVSAALRALEIALAAVQSSACRATVQL